MIRRPVTIGLLLFFLGAAHSKASPLTREASFSRNPVTDTSEVATVNGEGITVREFMLNSRPLRTRVINDFQLKYGAIYGSDFWSRKYDGESPSDVLKKKTLYLLIKIKIQQICAKNSGIVNDISYQGFLQAFTSENKRRVLARQAGAVIYGPVQYTEEVYYNYLFSNMITRLKEYLASSVFRITGETLMKIYENEKDSLYRQGFCTKTRLICYDPGRKSGSEEEDQITDEANTALRDICEKIKKDTSGIDAVLAAYQTEKGLSIRITDQVFNDSVYSPEEEDAVRAMVKETSGKMAVGQFSPVISFQGAFYIVLLKEKVTLGFRSFESCSTAIRMLLIDRMYEDYIQGLVMNAECKINKATYENIQY
ncbi:MAG: hypothetical protein NTW16_08290 [Bacteroidetes bacterium]|nr:hypothetical protein [Bacteroidota bacterium]